MIDKSLLKSGAVEENLIAQLKQKMGAYEQAGMQETPMYIEVKRQYEEYAAGRTFAEVVGREFSETFDNIIDELTKPISLNEDEDETDAEQ